MKITLNGEGRDVRAPLTVADLVASLGYTTAEVAVERNRALVPRVRHAETPVEESDEIEVVTLVGGG